MSAFLACVRACVLACVRSARYYDPRLLAREVPRIRTYRDVPARHSGNSIMNTHWRQDKHGIQELADLVVSPSGLFVCSPFRSFGCACVRSFVPLFVRPVRLFVRPSVIVGPECGTSALCCHRALQKNCRSAGFICFAVFLPRCFFVRRSVRSSVHVSTWLVSTPIMRGGWVGACVHACTQVASTGRTNTATTTPACQRDLTP